MLRKIHFVKKMAEKKTKLTAAQLPEEIVFKLTVKFITYSHPLYKKCFKILHQWRALSGVKKMFYVWVLITEMYIFIMHFIKYKL